MAKISDVADSLFRVGDAAKYAKEQAHGLADGVKAVTDSSQQFTPPSGANGTGGDQAPPGTPPPSGGNGTGTPFWERPSGGGGPGSGDQGSSNNGALRSDGFHEAGQPARIGGQVVGVWTGKGNAYTPGMPGYDERGQLVEIIGYDGTILWSVGARSERSAGNVGGGSGAVQSGGSRTGRGFGGGGGSGAPTSPAPPGASGGGDGALRITSPDVVEAINQLGKKIDGAFSLGTLARLDR